MFSFAWPYAVLLLVLPVLLRFILPKAHIAQGSALKVPFYHQIQLHNTSDKNFYALSLNALLMLLMWIALIGALMRPVILGPPHALPQAGRNIVLALDLSGSMSIPDMQHNGKKLNRLQVVKNVAKDFIHNRQGDKLALIVFGSRAFLQTPLTFDRKTLNAQLDDATISLAGPQTAIGDAIGLAVKRLQQTSPKNRVLILLTDGANNAGVLMPIKAAKLAKRNRIKIYTIGIGNNKMLVNGFFGPRMINPSSDLDIPALKAIANITGGLFFRAYNQKDLKSVYATINKLEPTQSKKQFYRSISEYYYWPLSMALLLSFILALNLLGFLSLAFWQKSQEAQRV